MTNRESPAFLLVERVMHLWMNGLWHWV